MKIKTLITLLLLLNICSASAHDLRSFPHITKKWSLKNETGVLEGSFLLCKNDTVYIETNTGIVHVAMNSLSEKDQQYLKEKNEFIQTLNTTKQRSHVSLSSKPSDSVNIWITLLVIGIAGLVLVSSSNKKSGATIALGLCLSSLVFIYGFSKTKIRPLQPATAPSQIDSAFIPFKPKINTYWSGNYFYVESLGIPDHEMMVGISNHGWQRQVPIPQCYIGTNAWPIPLNPVIANTPVPVNASHFTRGAIAIAVNGVPIFNPYTNTGIDAYLDGQLDNYGGHSGRADDYHYHLPPLHLYSQTSSNLPIAYALDGFAVYGATEPDGTAMTGLDANHGHYGTNGVYHYHGTTSAPYMISNMVGQITEDATNQIVPQAQAYAVRPGQNPLSGALITACTPSVSNNGYTIKYTLGSETDSIAYNWTTNGTYTFHYYSSSGTLDSVFNGFVPCIVPTGITDKTFENIQTYPNPVKDKLTIILPDNIGSEKVKGIYLFSIRGENLVHKRNFVSQLDLSGFSAGMYLLKIDFGSTQFSKKIIVQ